MMSDLIGSREKLLQSTKELIMEQGFSKTSISDILEASGVTRSNFYYHFKSKEDLGVAVFESMVKFLFDEIITPNLLDTSVSPEVRLNKFLDSLFIMLEHNGCEKGCPFTNLTSETNDCYPLLRKQIHKYVDKISSVIKDCLDEGIKAGDFKADTDTSELTSFIIAEIKGSMILTKALKDPQILKTNCKVLLNLISDHK